jgi:hypothetical protein
VLPPGHFHVEQQGEIGRADWDNSEVGVLALRFFQVVGFFVTQATIICYMGFCPPWSRHVSISSGTRVA